MYVYIPRILLPFDMVTSNEMNFILKNLVSDKASSSVTVSVFFHA